VAWAGAAWATAVPRRSQAALDVHLPGVQRGPQSGRALPATTGRMKGGGQFQHDERVARHRVRLTFPLTVVKPDQVKAGMDRSRRTSGAKSSITVAVQVTRAGFPCPAAPDVTRPGQGPEPAP